MIFILHCLDCDSFTLSIIFYINIKFLACFSSTRVYEPPDPPGYFDGHVWPMYLKHRQEINTITWEISKYLPSFSQGLLLLIYVKVEKGLLGKHFSQGVCKEMLRQPWGSPHLQLILAGHFFPWWFLSNLSESTLSSVEPPLPGCGL